MDGPAMKIVTANLVPARSEQPDHWESVSQLTGKPGHGQWVEYRMYSLYQRSMVKASLLYVGPKGKARRSWNEALLPGPHAAVIVRDWFRYGDWVPDEVEVLQPGDMVLFHEQPMMLVDRPDDSPYFVPAALDSV